MGVSVLDAVDDEKGVSLFCDAELPGVVECEWDGPVVCGLATETTFLVITRLTTGAFTVA